MLALDTKTRRILYIALLMLVACLLRYLMFRGYYFNHDEIQHIQMSEGKTLADVWKYSLGETHPPLGHFIRHYWGLLGDSVWHYRSLSMIFGLLHLPVIYLLGKDIANRSCGLIAATLMAFAHHAIMYSGAVRNYSMANLFLLLALLCLFRFLRSHNKKYAIGYAACAFISAMTMYLNLVVLGCFMLCLGTWLLLRRHYTTSFRLALCSAPAVLASAGHYLYQLKYIQSYLDTSIQQSNWYYSNHPIEKFITYFIELFKLIPSAVIPLNFGYTALTPNIGESLLFLFVLILVLYLIFSLFFEKGVFSALTEKMKLFLLSALLALPILFVMVYLLGDTYLLFPRRLYMFSLVFVIPFAAVIATCKLHLRLGIIISLLAVGLVFNPIACDAERTLSMRHWQQLKNLQIKKELHGHDYLLFAMTGVAAYLTDDKRGLYDALQQHGLTPDSYFSMPDGGKVFYAQFWPCNQCDLKKRLEDKLHEFAATKPYFVFLINRWETYSVYSNNVIFCMPKLKGAKTLIGFTPRRTEQEIQLFMVALPYETMAAFLQDGKALCHTQPFYQITPRD